MSQDFLTDAFIRLRQRLRVVSGRVIADSAGADDILQDSFVRLWRGRYPLRSEKEAEALLTKTVKNASLNEKRRKRGEPLEKDIAKELKMEPAAVRMQLSRARKTLRNSMTHE